LNPKNHLDFRKKYFFSNMNKIEKTSRKVALIFDADFLAFCMTIEQKEKKIKGRKK